MPTNSTSAKSTSKSKRSTSQKILIACCSLLLIFSCCISTVGTGFFIKYLFDDSVNGRTVSLDIMDTYSIQRTSFISPTGGTITASNGLSADATVEIPEGALFEDQEVSLGYRTIEDSRLGKDLNLLSNLAELKLSDSPGFNMPITVTLPYDETKVLKEELVAAYEYDEATGQLYSVTMIKHDSDAKTVTFLTSSPGSFIILEIDMTLEELKEKDINTDFKPMAESETYTLSEYLITKRLFELDKSNIRTSDAYSELEPRVKFITIVKEKLIENYQIPNDKDSKFLLMNLYVTQSPQIVITESIYMLVEGESFYFDIESNFTSVSPSLFISNAVLDELIAEAKSNFSDSEMIELTIDSDSLTDVADNTYITLNGEVSGTALVDGTEMTPTHIHAIYLIGSRNFGYAKAAILTDGTFLIDIPAKAASNIVYLLAGAETPTAAWSKLETVEFESNVSPTDLTITLTWDKNFSDLDLYVTDPTGETLSYNNLVSTSGGELVLDNISGYGPEQFRVSTEEGDVLLPGQYKIEVGYFADYDEIYTKTQAIPYTITINYLGNCIVKIGVLEEEDSIETVYTLTIE